jgi:uncharacterized protein
LLLSHGADPNLRDGKGDGVLCLASIRGAVGIVRSLLKYGAEPNQVDSKGRTPLYWAIFKRHREVAKALLEAGADAGAMSLDVFD